MTDHEIRIIGTAAAGDRVDMRALEIALRGLLDGATKAVRLHAEGRSTATAPLPAWVVEGAACQFRPVPSSGDRVFAFKVEDRPLAESALRQLDWIEPAKHSKSGIDLFEDALEAALQDEADSDLLDDGMIGAFKKLGEIFRWRVESIQVVNGRTVEFTPAGLQKIEARKRRTPRPQHVRVAGKLEGLRHTKHRFLLALEDGSTVAGIAESVPDDELAKLFGRQVVVEGTAYFHPTGKTQRLEATRLAPATELDLQLFTSRPRPLSGEGAPLVRPKPLKPGENWLDNIWGKWPGDETDEEIAEIIKEFS